MVNETVSDAHNEAAVKRLDRSVALLQDRIRLLEEENAKFVDMLAERGVEVRLSSEISLELPDPIRAPAEANLEAVALMREAERGLLEELTGDGEPLLVLRSGSRADTGAWFRKGVVWLCALSSEVVLFAAGRSPFVQKTDFSFLKESMYNHVTGEVVFAPAQGLAMDAVKLPPMDGYQMLAQIYAG